MASSSVSTYLDVAQAARGEASAEADTNREVMARAQVLARIAAGAERVDDLLDQSDLSTDVVKAALDWLSQSRLVVIHDEGGEKRLRLTETAKAALDNA